MPIVFNPVTGRHVLRCVTNHPNQQALWPIEGLKQLMSGDALAFIENGPLVRCYYCEVCGYVETYLAGPDGEAPHG